MVKIYRLLPGEAPFPDEEKAEVDGSPGDRAQPRSGAASNETVVRVH